MISLPLEALMQCEEKGCLAQLHVDLVLFVSGAFGFNPPTGHGWQVLANPSQGPMAPFLTRCPEHHTKLVKAAPSKLIAEPH